MELSVKGICKSFGAGNVLNNVDFTVHSGEICALLGENGAGKSTLMNIVGGIYSADAGGIFIDGKQVKFASPAESLDAGIAFIHQELNLVNDLTVYENMFLSCFPKKGPFLDRTRMIRETEALFDRIGIRLDPCAVVKDLDASYKQTVEIAKALRSDASVIIMDEPTTSLSAPEIKRIFSIMRTLKEKGISIIFISHKLDEVTEICDSFTVLRNGIAVKSGRIADVDARRLASYMVGHEIEYDKHTVREHGEEVLRLESLSDEQNFFDISLSLHRGEILGVTGLLGDGRSKLFGSVFGIYGGKYTGKIVIDGKEIHPANPYEALKYGIAYLPPDRKENAVIADMSIVDNGTAATIDGLKQGAFLDFKKQRELFSGQVSDLHIKSSDINGLITALSGGNQQKVMLARWILSDPKVLILDNPTQGVDVGAKEEIYAIIESLAARGIGVVVLSSEAAEIIRLCDRSLVLYHGHTVGTVSGEEMNEQNMMYLATGAGKESKAHE